MVLKRSSIMFLKKIIISQYALLLSYGFLKRVAFSLHMQTVVFVLILAILLLINFAVAMQSFQIETYRVDPFSRAIHLSSVGP